MTAIPWFFRSTVFVVAVVAHPLRVVTLLRVPTLIHLFSIFKPITTSSCSHFSPSIPPTPPSLPDIPSIMHPSPEVVFASLNI